jgi:hypothetical protein
MDILVFGQFSFFCEKSSFQSSQNVLRIELVLKIKNPHKRKAIRVSKF